MISVNNHEIDIYNDQITRADKKNFVLLNTVYWILCKRATSCPLSHDMVLIPIRKAIPGCLGGSKTHPPSRFCGGIGQLTHGCANLTSLTVSLTCLTVCLWHHLVHELFQDCTVSSLFKKNICSYGGGWGSCNSPQEGELIFPIVWFPETWKEGCVPCRHPLLTKQQEKQALRWESHAATSCQWVFNSSFVLGGQIACHV